MLSILVVVSYVMLYFAWLCVVGYVYFEEEKERNK